MSAVEEREWAALRDGDCAGTKGKWGAQRGLCCCFWRVAANSPCAMHPSLPLPPAAPADKPPFVMVIPPPNVTGTLHIGHALTNAIEVRCAGLHWAELPFWLCAYGCASRPPLSIAVLCLPCLPACLSTCIARRTL